MMRMGTALLAALLACAPAFAQEKGAEAPPEMQGTVMVGDKAPGFTLKDQAGQERTLESLLDADGFLALVFYRSADW